MPAVIGSWTGHLFKHADKVWSFKNNDSTNGSRDDFAGFDVVCQRQFQVTFVHPNRESERDTQAKALKARLEEQVRYKWKRRLQCETDDNPTIGQPGDTGYDLRKLP